MTRVRPIRWYAREDRPRVLLFYDGFELRAYDGFLGTVRSKARGSARRYYRLARSKQVFTGFYVAFQSLVKSLRLIGCDVHINNFALARRCPSYPIGLAGYPSVLARTESLSNPKLFGPGDPGFPSEAASAIARFRITKIIQPSAWYASFYEPFCPGKMVVWPAGIDTDDLLPAVNDAPVIDVLIYDKIRWNHNDVWSRTIGPFIDHLQSKGLSYKVIKYGDHTSGQFLDLVRGSRSFAFFCEHETQGLACEEVMSLNVPVFAWDEGVLCDPRQVGYVLGSLQVSSVPYWSDRCGVRFTINNMKESFDYFWHHRSTFKPRSYITSNLSLYRCGEAYLDLYNQLRC